MPPAEVSVPHPAPGDPSPPPPAILCPVCGSRRLHYLFSVANVRVVSCRDCRLMLRDSRTFDGGIAPSTLPPRPTAANLPAVIAQSFDLLRRYRGDSGGRLLGVVRGGPAILTAARADGLDITALDYTSPASLDRPPNEPPFDVVALYNVIDAVPDPALLLRQARALLAPGGVLFVAATSFDRWATRRFRHRWKEFLPERCFYFTRATLETLLIHGGFHELVARLGTRDPTGHAGSGMMFLARRCEPPAHPKLSLVVPAFNEARTFETNFEKLLAKTVPGLAIEIVVVESNSTDGTRALVARYQDHPRVTVVWQDAPRGKGHAVRAGLARITGDYVLIQDADLEYDLEDYEALLEPLVQGHAAFVLGARHGGDAWKMRDFSGQPTVSAILNLAHWFFTMLVNVGFRARLKDPFTMYKVFRRDCLYGLEFECNRFDFDFELVIKLLRKGYEPLEIPVNYRSRSFAEGKKVSFFGDPLTWLRALVKFRLQRLDPLENIACQRRNASREGRDGSPSRS